MFKTINKTKEWLLDVFLPRFCIGCGKEGTYICKNCDIFLSEADTFDLRSQKVMSVWEYDGLMEKIIHEVKFNGKYHIIGELVDRAFEKIELSLPPGAVITFVPMFKKREKERGFNQSELIARNIGSRAPNIRVVPLLKKLRDNESQVGLGVKERMENVRGVFAPVSRNILRQFDKVILIDDIYTTGATVKECVKILKKEGVKSVWVFTLARKQSI